MYDIIKRLKTIFLICNVIAKIVWLFVGCVLYLTIFVRTKAKSMKTGQLVTGTTGDKKGVQGEVIAVDNEAKKVQVKWPKGYMKTWVKISSVN